MTARRMRAEMTSITHHHSDDEQNDRGCFTIVKGADGVPEIKANATATDHANDRSGADIRLETQQDVGEKVRQHLRHHTPADDVEPCSPHRGNPLDLPWINSFNGFTQQFAEHATGMHAEGQHAGEGSEPNSRDKHQREDELVHGPEDIHKPARAVIEQWMRGEIPRSQQAQRDGNSQRQHRAPQGNAHRHQALPGVFAQMHKGRMEVALEEDTNVADITQQFERTQLHDLGGVAEHNGESHGGQQVASIP